MMLRYNGCVSACQPLPLLWLLSDARNDAALETALAALPRRSGFVYRHYHLAAPERRARFDALAAIARQRGHCVVVARSGEEAQGWGADGLYGKASALGTGGEGLLRLATAHDGAEMQQGLAAGADAIFLSPVFATASHPGATPLGPQGFSVLSQQSHVPVIALGGMTRARAQAMNWPRWGAIDGLSAEP
ncbi:MAG: thiamine phosphate synthase [Citromicrobium sp.]|nr:MAG: thiamine phosphate synthase [Citromicrobium sp.]